VKRFLLACLLAGCGGDAMTALTPAPAQLGVLVTGEARRGAIVTLHVDVLDATQPLDPTATLIGDAMRYDKLDVRASGGLTIQVTQATATSVDLRCAIDLAAPAAPTDLQIGTASGGTLSLADAFVIADAATPELLDAPRSVSLPRKDAAWLGFVDPLGGPALLEAEMVGAGAMFLSADGRYPSSLTTSAYASVVTTDGTARALVVTDANGAGMIEVTPKVTPLVRKSAMEPDDQPATSKNTLSVPGYSDGGVLSSAKDVDWYAIDLPIDVLGRILRVETRDEGDAQTDTQLALFLADGVTPAGPSSDDDDYLDILRSDGLLGGGRYFVRVSAGSAFDASHGKYGLLVRLD